MTSQVFFGVLITAIFLFGLFTMQKSKSQEMIHTSQQVQSTQTSTDNK